jgi:Tfp pilus assembly protein FimT
MRAATFEVMAGLQQARASSIVESRPASFCPSDAAGGCLPASTPGVAWRSALDGSPDTPRGHELPRGVRLLASRSPIRFWPTAHSASTGTLTICDIEGVARPRAIVISVTGRARLTDADDEACVP